MTGRGRVLGAVLAGGESRRYGRDKAAEPIAGVRLVERAATTLAEVCDDVVIVSSRSREARWPTVPDLRAGCGPLGGIESALAHAERLGSDGVVVLACDLPLVTAGTVHALVAALEASPAAAPSRAGHPGVEPLCAAYRTSCLGTARALLDGGERAAHALFTTVEGTLLERPLAELLNVNTVADGRRAERALGARAR